MDMVVLWSSNPHGVCYMETASLDGESSLKVRSAPSGVREVFDPLGVHTFQGTLVCEPPNERIFHFEGTLFHSSANSEVLETPLGDENFVPRGAALRNTREAYGVAVYTGSDTKLMRNTKKKRHKVSTLEKKANYQVRFMLLLVCLLSVVCTVCSFIAEASGTTPWYLEEVTNSSLLGHAFASFFSFIILFNTLIPISLYVSLEVVKILQAKRIQNDPELYDADQNIPTVVQTCSLNEELGQVSQIFTDKTGTLTRNRMEFIKFAYLASVGGETEVIIRPLPKDGQSLVSTKDGPAESCSNVDHPQLPTLQPDLWVGSIRNCTPFLICASLCHTVLAEVDPKSGSSVYSASSPDEECLVHGLTACGIKLLWRTENRMVIFSGKQEQQWEILHVLEFTSERKRMSIILRGKDQRIFLFCKGADDVILSRVTSPPSVIEKLQKTICHFSEEGLRTLVFAFRVLDHKQYQNWSLRYHSACASLQNRKKMVEKLTDEMECSMSLLGASALEDELQQSVPETIQLLKRAGIEFWMLTGDKRETAVSIAHSCGLLNSNMQLLEIKSVRPRCVIESTINSHIAHIMKENNACGLLLEGSALECLLKKDIKYHYRASLLYELCTLCRSIVCYRISPLQKAQVVDLAKSYSNNITLSIGDGGNDVSMIRTAHVGVGICGHEGLQAARSADYSVAQFRFLSRLLLVHGHWNYRRISKLVLYSFYKNIVLQFAQFLYCFSNAFTGQSLYEPWALALYNVAFAAFPIMVLGIFDENCTDRVLLQEVERYYPRGPQNKYFNPRIFWSYTLNGIYHCLFLHFLVHYSAFGTISAPDGRILSLHACGFIAYSCSVFLITAKVALETRNFGLPSLFAVFGSLAAWYIFWFLYGSALGAFSSPRVQAVGFDAYYIPHNTLSFPLPWLLTLLIVTVVPMRDILWKCRSRSFASTVGLGIGKFFEKTWTICIRTLKRTCKPFYWSTKEPIFRLDVRG